jgi:hypothetical protein
VLAILGYIMKTSVKSNLSATVLKVGAYFVRLDVSTSIPEHPLFWHWQLKIPSPSNQCIPFGAWKGISSIKAFFSYFTVVMIANQEIILFPV